MIAWIEAAALAAGTLVSEDLTCIAAGLSVRSGRIDPLTAATGCCVGIYLGDLGLWAVGRLVGTRLLRAGRVARWSARILPPERLARFAAWFDRHAAVAVLVGRIVPGSRLPIYVAAGCAGRGAGRFFLWAAIAALLWVPLLVGMAVALGGTILGPAEFLIGAGRPAVALAALALFLCVAGARLLGAARRRARLAAAVSRIWRWEFWPAWLFYLPLVPWIAWLSIRYGGFTTMTAANPGIPDGGFVGESKQDILDRLPARVTAPGVRIAPGHPERRLDELRRALQDRGWEFPIVGKPDVGERGAGVRILRSIDDAARYLRRHPAAVLAQRYHPGPHEAGIFYYRIPGEPHGRIFSITDKRFPEVVGDGESTLEDLIWTHPRYRMQARTFLARHAAERDRTPAAGERVRLAHAGNHCQGTMFADGGHLITPELERAVDVIARSFEGFFIGRFDVRYADVASFKAGRDFTIIELNGVTSESTNIYDPSRSIVWAWGTLRRQWSLLFRIGSINRRLGAGPSRARDLLRAVVAWRRQTPPLPIAD